MNTMFPDEAEYHKTLIWQPEIETLHSLVTYITPRRRLWVSFNFTCPNYEHWS